MTPREGQTNACQSQPNENTKIGKTAAGEWMPGRSGNKENPVCDGRDCNQIEGDSRREWCTDEAERDGFWAPHWMTRSAMIIYVRGRTRYQEDS
jgi:hypothetical protein